MRSLLLALVLVASLVANAVASQANVCAMQPTAIQPMADCPMMGDSRAAESPKKMDVKSAGCLVSCYGFGAQTLPVPVIHQLAELPSELPAAAVAVPLSSTSSGVPTPPPDLV